LKKTSELPIVFREEKSYGLKSNSSYQFDLPKKLSPEDKSELLKYAKSQSSVYVSHKQVRDLYELKGEGFILVVDSEGDNDRVHIRTENGHSIMIGLFSGLLISLFSFAMNLGDSISWRTFGIPLILFFMSAFYFIIAQKFFTKTVEKQETKMLEMIQEIEKIQTKPHEPDPLIR